MQRVSDHMSARRAKPVARVGCQGRNIVRQFQCKCFAIDASCMLFRVTSCAPADARGVEETQSGSVSDALPQHSLPSRCRSLCSSSFGADLVIRDRFLTRSDAVCESFRCLDGDLTSFVGRSCDGRTNARRSASTAVRSYPRRDSLSLFGGVILGLFPTVFGKAR
jgi:hypothetical protein